MELTLENCKHRLAHFNQHGYWTADKPAMIISSLIELVEKGDEENQRLADLYNNDIYKIEAEIIEKDTLIESQKAEIESLQRRIRFGTIANFDIQEGEKP